MGNLKKYTCPLCGYTFTQEESVCPTCCSFAKTCATVCCPHCHYRFAEDSRTVTFFKKLFKKGEKDE
jgi:predicted amidophosphoribosyltransferase